MNVFVNPVDVVVQAFRRRGDVSAFFLARAQKLAYIEDEFAEPIPNFNDEFVDEILMTSAYGSLLAAGVYPDILVEVCILFRALARVGEELRTEYKQQKLPLGNGRPSDHFPLFQWCCYMLVRDRVDGLRFYTEFRDLAAVVYRKTITVESYRRTLKRTLAEFRAVLVQRRSDRDHATITRA